MSRYRQEWGPCTPRRRFNEPCRFGVIADTHIYPNNQRSIPDGVKRLFARAGLAFLVHLGDVNTRFVLEELAEIAPVIAVPGNNDEPELHFMLPETTRFWVGDRSFGVLHGDGGRSAKTEAKRRFGEKVDCVLFGHSHQPLIEQAGDTIMFNPGSATDRRWSAHFGVGLITVSGGAIHPELVLFQHGDHLDNIEIEPVGQAE